MAGSNKEYRTGWTWDPPPPGWYRTRRTGGELWYWDGAKWAVSELAGPQPSTGNDDPRPPRQGSHPLWKWAAIALAGGLGVSLFVINRDSGRGNLSSSPVLPTASSTSVVPSESSSPTSIASSDVTTPRDDTTWSAPPTFRTSAAPTSTLDPYAPDYGNGFNQRFVDDLRAAGLVGGSDRAWIRLGWAVCDYYDREAAGALRPGGGFAMAMDVVEEANLGKTAARSFIRLAVTGICPENVGLLN